MSYQYSKYKGIEQKTADEAIMEIFGSPLSRYGIVAEKAFDEEEGLVTTRRIAELEHCSASEVAERVKRIQPELVRCTKDGNPYIKGIRLQNKGPQRFPPWNPL